jgi:hypothetical protein
MKAAAAVHAASGEGMQPEMGKLIDNAMDLIDVDNPSERCMVPKTYARPSLNLRRISELVDLISSTRGKTTWAVFTSTSSAGPLRRGRTPFPAAPRLKPSGLGVLQQSPGHDS